MADSKVSLKEKINNSKVAKTTIKVASYVLTAGAAVAGTLLVTKKLAGKK